MTRYAGQLAMEALRGVGSPDGDKAKVDPAEAAGPRCLGTPECCCPACHARMMRNAPTATDAMRQGEERGCPTTPDAATESWVAVGCLTCTQGAEYVPEKGPGTGWVNVPDGWLCPDCAAEAIRRGADDGDLLADLQRGDVVVKPGRPVYVLTGEKRPPREGEDYLIGPYTVGTSDGSRMFRRGGPKQIVRLLSREPDAMRQGEDRG